MTTKSRPAYNSIAATDDVHWKLEKWRRHLSDKWGERWTFSQTIDWLLDNAGPPETWEERNAASQDQTIGAEGEDEQHLRAVQEAAPSDSDPAQ